MRVVILAGGFGTRLAEETEIKPKPMVEIGGRPILWHIMKSYAHFGFDQFYLALGYKGETIKKYFMDLNSLNGHLHIQLGSGTVQREAEKVENWDIHLVDTGLNTSTGGRLKRLEPYLKENTFMLTYGDGVSSIDLQALLSFHREQKRLATVTAVRPPARFGGLVLENGLVSAFSEKPQIGEGWINGGFFVFEPGVFDYLAGDETNLEADALPLIAADGQLAAYQHDGFWQCMDTLREKYILEKLWDSNEAPWKVWDS